MGRVRDGVAEGEAKLQPQTLPTGKLRPNRALQNMPDPRLIARQTLSPIPAILHFFGKFHTMIQKRLRMATRRMVAHIFHRLRDELQLAPGIGSRRQMPNMLRQLFQFRFRQQ